MIAALVVVHCLFALFGLLAVVGKGSEFQPVGMQVAVNFMGGAMTAVSVLTVLALMGVIG